MVLRGIFNLHGNRICVRFKMCMILSDMIHVKDHYCQGTLDYNISDLTEQRDRANGT